MSGTGEERICTKYQNLWLHFTGLMKTFVSHLPGYQNFFVSNPYKYRVRKLVVILELTKNKENKNEEQKFRKHIFYQIAVIFKLGGQLNGELR